MKKEKIVFIISLIIMTLSSMVSAFAVSAYLYNSDEISYNNSQSGIQSTDVQGAINELYGHATDYTEIKKYFKNNPTIEFNGSWLDFYVNGNNRMALGVNSSGISTISAKNANGENGKGTLDLRGNPVQINGKNVGDIIKSKYVSISCSDLTKAKNLSSYISLDSGYKFLSWQTNAISTGWTTEKPIYCAEPNSTNCTPYWNGSLSCTTSNTSHKINFFYFEIIS